MRLQRDRPVGVFDSGMGGLSVLRALEKRLPGENYIYIGDNAHAPYGTKSEDEIYCLSKAIVARLLTRDVKAIVIACNTATSAAAKRLRAEYTLPILGMEPALKPAALCVKSAPVLVLATPATLSLDKFQALMAAYGEHAYCEPCPELVAFVERGELQSAALDAYLAEKLAKYRALGVRALVLGCTHFVFAKAAIRRALPSVPLFDGNDGVARQLEAVLRENDALSARAHGFSERITTSDSEAVRENMERLYQMEADGNEQ